MCHSYTSSPLALSCCTMRGKLAVVTGANKGIGLEIVKGLCQRFDGIVYLTARDRSRGEEAVLQLNELGFEPRFHLLDVSNRDSMISFRDYVKSNYEGIDVLINNAGVGGVGNDPELIVGINYGGLKLAQEILFPILREGARVVNVSSSCGHLSNVKVPYWIERLSKNDLTAPDVDAFVDWFMTSFKNGTWQEYSIAEGNIPAYRVSKVAISALSLVQQRELADRGINVNSVHPGVVKTDMTMGGGRLLPQEGARAPLWLALDAPDSVKGAYVWEDCSLVDWYDHKGDWYFKIKDVL